MTQDEWGRDKAEFVARPANVLSSMFAHQVLIGDVRARHARRAGADR